MYQKLLNKLNSVDKKVFPIMHKGIIFAEIIAIISLIIMYIYNKFYISYDLYLSSLILFRTSIIIALSFIICGFAVDEIKKQM